jgi:23S rRNA (guanosine2251-2'-O)-methyltransferase
MTQKLKLDELNRASIEEFKSQEKIPLILILDNIRSMNNVGSAFRTSDAFNIEKLFLVGITATPPNREITKTALGADESVAWEHSTDIVALIENLKAQGYTICAIEQVQNSIKLNDFLPEKDKKYAYIFGNEVFGVSDDAINCSDICLEIPQYGTKHSLNVSVTLGITCWDFILKCKL